MKCSGSCRQFCRWIEAMPYHKKYTLTKEDQPALPECFETTLLGEMVVGAKRQLRGPHGAHVHEFSDRWVVHRDRVNADQDPVGHLLKDAPEYIISAAAMILTGMAIGKNGKGARGGNLLAGGLVGAMALLTGKFLKMVDEDAREDEASDGGAT